MTTNNESEDKRIEYETDAFLWAVAPFGGRDIKEMIKTALSGGHDGDWCAEEITQFMEDCDTKMADIDPNYVVYSSLLQEARGDIEELTDKDILNDVEHEVNVYGNFMCTSLDYSEEAKEELLEILKETVEEDETDALKWLIEEIDFREELEERRKEYAEENSEEEES